VSPATVDCSESELIFRSGADTSAVTDRLACARVSHSGSEFDVVDTPGLGENATADAKHKTEILHLLKTSPNVAAIIFCFRSDAYRPLCLIPELCASVAGHLIMSHWKTCHCWINNSTAVHLLQARAH
jgi:hypothetical protein